MYISGTSCKWCGPCCTCPGSKSGMPHTNVMLRLARIGRDRPYPASRTGDTHLPQSIQRARGRMHTPLVARNIQATKLFGLPATMTYRQCGFTPLLPCDFPPARDCIHRIASPDLPTSRLLFMQTRVKMSFHPSFALTGVGDVLAGHIQWCAATPWVGASDAQPNLPRRRGPEGAARDAVRGTRTGPAAAGAAVGLPWRACGACVRPVSRPTRGVHHPGTTIILFYRPKPSQTAPVVSFRCRCLVM